MLIDVSGSPEKKQEINLQKSWDVNYWCEEFNLRAEELREIVRAVGPKVADVRMFLAKKLLLSWPQAY